MSDINVTDQRSRATKSEIPESLRAKKPLPKDPALVKFIQQIKAKFDRKLAEGQNR